MAIERPESDVVEWIDQMLGADDVDAWIDSQIQRGPRDDYSVDRRQIMCPWGPHEFHGTPRGSCPGSHLTREEFAAAKESMRVSGTRRNPHYTFNEDAASLSVDIIPGGQVPLWEADARQQGYTLADIEAMRGGLVRPYLPPVIRGPVIQDRSGLVGPDGSILDQLSAGLPQIPRVPMPRPLVRFWGVGPDGMTQVMQGVLIINDWTYRSDGHSTTYEITASLRDPTEYMFTPEALLDSMTPDVPELPAPTEPLELDRISMEVQNRIAAEDSTLEGFQAIGTLDPDALQFDTDYEYVEAWGGRRVRTVERHSVTMAMDAEHVNTPLLQELFFGGPSAPDLPGLPSEEDQTTQP